MSVLQRLAIVTAALVAMLLLVGDSGTMKELLRAAERPCMERLP